MTSREHPTATITTPNSTPGQSGRFGSESVAAFVGMRNLALHLAQGLNWQDRKTKQGSVIYVAAEGGLAAR